MRPKGFTLFELAGVLVILGILSSLAMFSWSDTSMRLIAQAQRLKTDIRYIQMLSMAEHQMYRINFSSSQYTITESDGATPVYFPGSNVNTITFDTGITATANVSQLLFNSFGVPYTTTSTALTSNASITFTMTGSGSTDTVVVRPETGYASIS